MKSDVRWIIGLFVLCLALFLPLLPERADALQAGAAAYDITPAVDEMKVPLSGYSERKGKLGEQGGTSELVGQAFLGKGQPATGVHDHLFAKALVLGHGQSEVAIVCLDLVAVTGSLREQVLMELEGTGIKDHNLLITASHTHSGAAVMAKNFLEGVVWGRSDEKLFEMTAAKIARAVRDAQARLGPASIRVAEKKVPGLTRNRRDPSYDYGSRRFTDAYDPDDPENVTDDTITVVRVDDEEGEPIAVLVAFATHATVLGADNFLVSADWPGVMQHELSAAYPGAVIMYMNGAEGDQAPAMPGSPDDFECMEIIGKNIARAALPLVEQAEPVDATPIRSVIVKRKLPGARLMGIKLPVPLIRTWFPAMPLMAVRVGDIVFMGCPLEMISEMGITMKEGARGAGFKYPIVAGLANDHYGYCATPDEYFEGGYEADLTVYGEIEAGLVIGEQMMLVRKLK